MYFIDKGSGDCILFIHGIGKQMSHLNTIESLPLT